MTEEYVIPAHDPVREKRRHYGTILLAALTLLTALNTVALFLIYDRLSPITESAMELDEGNTEAPPAEETPAEEPPAAEHDEVPTKTSSNPNDA